MSDRTLGILRNYHLKRQVQTKTQLEIWVICVYSLLRSVF